MIHTKLDSCQQGAYRDILLFLFFGGITIHAVKLYIIHDAAYSYLIIMPRPDDSRNMGSVVLFVVNIWIQYSYVQIFMIRVKPIIHNADSDGRKLVSILPGRKDLRRLDPPVVSAWIIFVPIHAKHALKGVFPWIIGIIEVGIFNSHHQVDRRIFDLLVFHRLITDRFKFFSIISRFYPDLILMQSRNCADNFTI